MKVIFINGARAELTWHQMRSFFWHPHFVSLVLALSGIVVLLRPYDDMVDFDVIRLTLFYANAVLCFVVLLVSSVYLTQRLERVVYSSPCIILAVTGATIYGMFSAMLLGAARPIAEDVVLVILFNVVFGILGEIILASYLLPRIMADVSGVWTGAVPVNPAADPRGQSPRSIESDIDPLPAPPATFPNQPSAFMPAEEARKQPPDTVQAHLPDREQSQVIINLFGAEFLAYEVFAVSADAHYVKVLLRGGRTRLLRGRMSDAVKSMPSGSGFMIHRSHFVFARAVTGLETDSGQTRVTLVDGTRLPVARTRIQETRDLVAGLAEMEKAP